MNWRDQPELASLHRTAQAMFVAGARFSRASDEAAPIAELWRELADVYDQVYAQLPRQAVELREIIAQLAERARQLQLLHGDWQHQLAPDELSRRIDAAIGA